MSLLSYKIYIQGDPWVIREIRLGRERFYGRCSIENERKARNKKIALPVSFLWKIEFETVRFKVRRYNAEPRELVEIPRNASLYSTSFSKFIKRRLVRVYVPNILYEMRSIDASN